MHFSEFAMGWKYAFFLGKMHIFCIFSVYSTHFPAIHNDNSINMHFWGPGKCILMEMIEIRHFCGNMQKICILPFFAYFQGIKNAYFHKNVWFQPFPSICIFEALEICRKYAFYLGKMHIFCIFSVYSTHFPAIHHDNSTNMHFWGIGLMQKICILPR